MKLRTCKECLNLERSFFIFFSLKYKWGSKRENYYIYDIIHVKNIEQSKNSEKPFRY